MILHYELGGFHLVLTTVCVKYEVFIFQSVEQCEVGHFKKLTLYYCGHMDGPSFESIGIKSF